MKNIAFLFIISSLILQPVFAEQTSKEKSKTTAVDMTGKWRSKSIYHMLSANWKVYSRLADKHLSLIHI